MKKFDEAIKFVNLHQEGKVLAKTIDQLLNELYNLEFVAKIEKSMQQASDDQVVKFALDDICK